MKKVIDAMHTKKMSWEHADEAVEINGEEYSDGMEAVIHVFNHSSNSTRS